MNSKTFHLLRMAVLPAGMIGHAAVLTVGHANTGCPSAQYNTIAAAIAAASAGDTITICPAVYPEQLFITKPLTLIGTDVPASSTQQGKYAINRALIQPAMTDMQDYPHEAAITVMNTTGVTIQNLAVDASNNSVSGCGLPVSGIHFLNSSGKVFGNAITGAVLHDVQTCSKVLGNGFGVRVDSDGTQPGPFEVVIEENSIHDYTADGVFVVGPGAGVSTAPVTVEVRDNSISGVGPSSGTPQFGVFIYGAVGHITGNRITEGTCGSLAVEPTCIAVRSEGVTLRGAEAGTTVDHNFIMNAQSGIFINGGTGHTISNNFIGNIDGLDGIDVEGLTDSVIEANTISGVLPLSNEGCGVFEDTGTKVSGNIILNTKVNDAYCGVTYVAADQVMLGSYFNTLYTEVNGDLNPNGLPTVEPGQTGAASALRTHRTVRFE